MAYQRLKDVYDSLQANAALSSMADITVGWNHEDISYPSVNIIQAGGSAVGRFGYKSDNEVNEIATFQIDIYSRTSLMQTYQILDLLRPIMISSGYEKTADSDAFEDEVDAHRKITRWSLETIV